ncbi:hypothetical protein [Amycolatopsis taiwanensis]|uniref:Uncharacterized protein n=1 Tax=Amycolatopsis taiwanensis TaxID=342230 RepID=A0A9W6VES9_9PSEU|nr:hypothetical protein [Amycolatopsis taiwanensis]GLY63801.1 hypothetical protein Atai01_04200 [Amycolatopsis taiwanensis]
MAVRDAGISARAARLGRRVLVAAGFGFAVWIIGALLSGTSASADEAQPAGGHDRPPRHDLHDLPGPNLLTNLTGTLTDTLTNTLTGTLTSLVGTVGQVAGQLTQVTQAVVAPVQTAIDLPGSTVETLLPLDTHTEVPLPGKSTWSRPDEGSTRDEVLAPPPPPPPPPLPAPVPAPIVTAVPERPSKPRSVTDIQFTQSVARPDSSTHAHQTDPAPPPMHSGDQTIGVAASHDGGGAGKHPFIVLGPRLIGADLQPGGVAAGRHMPHHGKDAALPTTSPD